MGPGGIGGAVRIRGRLVRGSGYRAPGGALLAAGGAKQYASGCPGPSPGICSVGSLDAAIVANLDGAPVHRARSDTLRIDCLGGDAGVERGTVIRPEQAAKVVAISRQRSAFSLCFGI